jgi:serine/threonine protein kinase/Tol biopolymer transport system component
VRDKADEAWLLALAARISEGTAPDWDSVADQINNPDAMALLEELRAVSAVADAHRTAVGSTARVVHAVSERLAPPLPTAWRHLMLLAVVGTGAYGTVYRGWDTRLDREVAIKILRKVAPAARSPIVEARMLARVRHPNVVTVYGADEDDEQVGIWMEYIDGETLASFVQTRGTMSDREVSGVGVDLCRALSALHAAGLLHRDLKAHNVMRQSGGRIVLMDFSSVHAVDSTEPAAAVGTPLDMAPELFSREPPTVAADIYSLGVLLFYLLTGRYPVYGATLGDVRRGHEQNERQRLRDLRPDIPDQIVQVVERALAVEPARRYRTSGEFEHALMSASGTSTAVIEEIATSASRARRVQETLSRWLPAAVVLMGIIGMILPSAIDYARHHNPPVSLAPVHFTLGPPYNNASWPRLSPNGRWVAFGAIAEGRQVLWLRDLSTNETRRLPQTAAAETPFWSADSRMLAFFDDRQLKAIDIERGGIVAIADAAKPRGGDWNRDGVILFAPTPSSGLYTVRSDGTAITQVTTLDEDHGEYHHGWPKFLPDGRRFLFLVVSSQPEVSGIYLGSLDSPERRRLMPAYSRVAYSPTGHLVFVRNGSLVAQPFDAKSGTLTGEPVQVVPSVKHHRQGDTALDVSDTGTMIYRPAEELPVTRLVLYDRRGREVQSIAADAFFRQPRLSPDGRRLLAERATSDQPSPDIWMYDLERGSAAQMTRDEAPDTRPVWSPDGRSFAFSSNRGRQYDVYRKQVDGVAPEELLYTSQGDKFVEDWAPDGSYLSGVVVGEGLWALPAHGGRPWQIRAKLDALTDPSQSAISPDGQYVAYTSSEAETPEVFVEPLPPSGTRWQVSTNGGAEPHWRGDGRELFYLSPDGGLMSVELPPGPKFRPQVPRLLFRVSVSEIAAPSDFTVSRDGRHIVINTLVGDPATPPIHVIVNWTHLLER